MILKFNSKRNSLKDCLGRIQNSEELTNLVRKNMDTLNQKTNTNIKREQKENNYFPNKKFSLGNIQENIKKPEIKKDSLDKSVKETIQTSFNIYSGKLSFTEQEKSVKNKSYFDNSYISRAEIIPDQTDTLNSPIKLSSYRNSVKNDVKNEILIEKLTVENNLLRKEIIYLKVLLK